ncbi:ketopantoate reductase family protein [Brenneria izadpanahii]|uniref:2-dehydropantoate 2-reductase n=1 Tax=Brenneria izadpanahii TaxID=2722756 RepID=A0ABX7US06_9GAMM|nr:2-dehydropantoate 2-reductase [Brenneria izadpanahii]QTF08519.1 ketopantoate reductase family protein [Brenneria izadpanahii]
MNADQQTPILIWGAGAIGASLGAAFAAAGYPVVFVDQEQMHVDAMNSGGLYIEGPIREQHLAVRAYTPEDLQGRYDLIFLAVKAHHTAFACRQLRPFLTENGVVVSAQNGLNELDIAAVLGRERTMGCFVNFGADYLYPGHIMYGGRAAVVVGELDGRTTERVKSVHALLQTFDDRAVLTDNIWGYLWGKLVYGAMLYATALTDGAIWECLDHPNYRDVFISLGKEIAAVAAAEGVALEAFDGFEPSAYAPDAPMPLALASLDAMVEHNRRSTKTHSGIWRDLAIRQRRTEVDAQLGPILDAARRHGIAVPLTRRLIELIHACEDGLPRVWGNLSVLRAAQRNTRYADKV